MSAVRTLFRTTVKQRFGFIPLCLHSAGESGKQPEAEQRRCPAPSPLLLGSRPGAAQPRGLPRPGSEEQSRPSAGTAQSRSPAWLSRESKTLFLRVTVAARGVSLTRVCWCLFQTHTTALAEVFSTDGAFEHVFAVGRVVRTVGSTQAGRSGSTAPRVTDPEPALGGSISSNLQAPSRA